MNTEVIKESKSLIYWIGAFELSLGFALADAGVVTWMAGMMTATQVIAWAAACVIIAFGTLVTIYAMRPDSSGSVRAVCSAIANILDLSLARYVGKGMRISQRAGLPDDVIMRLGLKRHTKDARPQLLEARTAGELMNVRI